MSQKICSVSPNMGISNIRWHSEPGENSGNSQQVCSGKMVHQCQSVLQTTGVNNCIGL